jgi:AcrR family transcriptional regulator
VQHLIEAAARVLGRQGYTNVTMKDIAREAGVTSGTLHYYFETKAQLLAAVVRDFCDRLRSDAAAAFDEAAGANPLMRAYAALQATEDRVTAHPENQRLLLDMIGQSFTDRGTSEQLGQLYRDLNATTRTMVEELNHEVPTPLPVPIADFAGMIVAAMDGLAIQQLIDPTRDQKGLYRAFAFLLLCSLAASYAEAGQPVPAVSQMLAALSRGGDEDPMRPVNVAQNTAFGQRGDRREGLSQLDEV